MAIAPLSADRRLLDHSSVRWIRLTVKKCCKAEKRADSTSVGAALMRRCPLRARRFAARNLGLPLRDCQKQSASAFGISVTVRSADVQLLTGKLECWSRATVLYLR